ncbi:chromosomal replication initiator protein DnaA [Mesomycoplasma molare]|uniref:Chromosomal replication initiator protein DnaA n=1 Tax=Mesomycoplasma molare TaxID=171288 RepID=A0ABY5TYT3_9BACT|nr:chromosomal replication initiator protein DnaA [Mesomycoplasma molare]UWD34209.1 chromosomal replication initiator protein DnaA [Mesomycoplasma molare]
MNLKVENNVSNLKKETKKILKNIEKKVQDFIIFSTFFSQLKINKISNTEIVFLVENSYIKQEINDKFIEILENSVLNTFKQKLKIELITLEESLENDNEQENKKVVNKIVKKNDGIINFSDNLIKNLTFDKFVSGKFNQDLIKISSSLINNKTSEFNPIFIHSNSGMGKTLFLNALGNELKKISLTSYFLNPDNFTNEISLILKNKDIEEINKFSNILENVDVLLIDDVQMLGNRTKTLEFLFNIINNLTNKNKQIIICADKRPEFLGGFEERFITRFQSGLVLEIKRPNNEDLLKIIKFKLEDKGFDLSKWEKSALNFLTRNFYKSIRELEGALNTIKFSVSNSSKEIVFNENLMKNIFQNTAYQEKEITSDRIIETVCSYYKIKINEVISKSRKKEIVVARSMCIYLMRTLMSLSYEKIGIILGGKDHSSILLSYKKMLNDLEKAPEIKNAILNITTKVTKVI